jgi:hypothetical protein
MTTKRPVWLNWSQVKRRPTVVARLSFSRLVCSVVALWRWIASVGEVGWRNATIALTIMAVLGYLFAWSYIFHGPVSVELAKDQFVFGPDVRARAVTPVLLGLAGFVTLVATLWRGTISERQTEEQTRQNDSKEEADLGLLLEKGHEHTAKGKVDDIALGIAMLETVAQAKNDKYASYALYVIGSQLEPCFQMSGTDRDRIYIQIRAVFQRIAGDKEKSMRRPNTRLKVDAGHYDQYGVLAEQHSRVISLFKHIPTCSIANGQLIIDTDVLAILNDDITDFSLQNCRIVPVSQDGFGLFSGGGPLEINKVASKRYANCQIEGFAVREIGDAFMFSDGSPQTTFISCNLTNTNLASRAILESCKFRNCYFHSDDAPYIEGPEGPEKFDREILAEYGITSRPTLLNAFPT